MKDVSVEEVSIQLKGGVSLYIGAEVPPDRNTLLELEYGQALAEGEEPLQLLEGAAYEYELPAGFELRDKSGSIVKPSRRKPERGRITPGIYVGRLMLQVYRENSLFDEIAIEIRSLKADYRSEYRKMLEDIAEYAVELVFIHSSPTTQKLTSNFSKKSSVLYQQFAFIQSLINSENFRNAVNRVTSMPVTKWKQTEEELDIRRAGKISGSQVRQIASRSNRVRIPENHSLRGLGLNSLPDRITSRVKTDTVDTPENRFVKHALETFRRFCGTVVSVIDKNAEGKEKRKPFIYDEALLLEKHLGQYLSHNVFREVSNPSSLPLNSPVLQRKAGYREILRSFLMFDLAASLNWDGLNDDTYDAGKRDVATLYEYWLFFKLLELVKEVFGIPASATEDLINKSKDGFGIQLKSGRQTIVKGLFINEKRNLNIRFSYNRTFSHSAYPSGGTWTQQMRPDYTLSVWPEGFRESEAEKQELIVHIHFDAKYKVDGLSYLFSEIESQEDENLLSREHIEQKEGNYKRGDLLKMHAYKDAIRRSGGAYVLYPGSRSKIHEGFHEILPGLGAFAISPHNSAEGITELKKFIVKVVNHFSSRTTQREEASFQTYKVHRNNPDSVFESPLLQQLVPEFRGESTKPVRSGPVKDTTVLIGYYNSEQYVWIEKTGLYNIRLDSKGGLEKLNRETLQASYLLLHGKGELVSDKLWRIKSSEPVVMSRQELKDRDYPTEPSQEAYLVYKVELVENSLSKIKWNLRNLEDFKGGRSLVRPFSVKMTDFLKIADNSG